MADSLNSNRNDEPSQDAAFFEELSCALDQVPVPTDLQTRIVRRLQQEARVPEDVSVLKRAADDAGHDDVPFEQSASVAGGEVNAGGVKCGKIMASRFSSGAGWWIGVAASILVLAGLYFLGRPLTTDQLVEHCLKNLDSLVRSESELILDEHFDYAEVLGRLSLARSTRSEGYYRQLAGSFGERCKTWKLTVENQPAFYVMEFVDPARVNDLDEQPRVIRLQSGGWSMAAFRSQDRVFVIAMRGDIRRHLVTGPLA